MAQVLARVGACLGAVAASLSSLWLTASVPLTPALHALAWAALVATALASALGALRLAAGLRNAGRDADRMLDVVSRAWIATFIAIVLAVEGSAALERHQSMQQQRLCANAARLLAADATRLRAYGLRCDVLRADRS